MTTPALVAALVAIAATPLVVGVVAVVLVRRVRALGADVGSSLRRLEDARLDFEVERAVMRRESARLRATSDRGRAGWGPLSHHPEDAPPTATLASDGILRATVVE